MATTTKVIPALPESTIATGDIIYWDTDQFEKDLLLDRHWDS